MLNCLLSQVCYYDYEDFKLALSDFLFGLQSLLLSILKKGVELICRLGGIILRDGSGFICYAYGSLREDFRGC
jgi:hypothetical protein